MAFDGNGNWVSAFSAVADKDAGYKILASRFDNIFIADITQGFDNCVTRDGQGIMQTDFNANNNKVINLANPVNNGDGVNLGTLNTKDALVVHLGGTETISGNKTFSGYVNVTSTTFNESLTGCAMPDFSSAIEITSGYVAPVHGWFEGVCESAYNYSIIVDGVVMVSKTYSNTMVGFPFSIAVPKGATITFESVSIPKFIPCTGFLNAVPPI